MSSLQSQSLQCYPVVQTLSYSEPDAFQKLSRCEAPKVNQGVHSFITKYRDMREISSGPIRKHPTEIL